MGNLKNLSNEISISSLIFVAKYANLFSPQQMKTSKDRAFYSCEPIIA